MILLTGDKASMDAATLTALADFYKVFGDPTRLRILQTLMRGDHCVHDLADALGMQQSAVSHQLRILKQAHLVRSRRVGKEAHYSLSDEHVRTVFEQGLVHVNEGTAGSR
jgi:DNA-binding transcriptional ArsR family regulator